MRKIHEYYSKNRRVINRAPKKLTDTYQKKVDVERLSTLTLTLVLPKKNHQIIFNIELDLPSLKGIVRDSL